MDSIGRMPYTHKSAQLIYVCGLLCMSARHIVHECGLLYTSVRLIVHECTTYCARVHGA